MQQYSLELRLGLGLRLGLVTSWEYGGGKNFPRATNFPRHRDTVHDNQRKSHAGNETVSH